MEGSCENFSRIQRMGIDKNNGGMGAVKVLIGRVCMWCRYGGMAGYYEAVFYDNVESSV